MSKGWSAALCLGGCVVLLLLSLSACSRSKDRAVQELQRLNLKFTTDDYVRSAGLGDLKAVGLFSEAGVDVNALNSDGLNALVASAERGRVDVVKFLLDHKADPNAAGQQGQTALMAAAENNHPDIVQLLLDRKANPGTKDRNGWTALLKAAYRNHAPCVQILADQDRPEINRALLVASLIGAKESVKALLDNGADPDARSEDRRTPLMLAASKGHKEVIKLLLDAGADPALTDRSGETAESVATAKGFPEVATLLRNAPPPAADQKPKAPGAVAQNGSAAPAGPLPGQQPNAGVSDQDLLNQPGPGSSPATAAPAASGSPLADQGQGLKAARSGTNSTGTPGNGGRQLLRNVIAVTEIHENFLPVTLTEVQGKKAHLRNNNDGDQYTVGVGDQLRGLDYQVVDVQARNVSDKDGNPVDASRVKLREAKTGETLSLIKGIPAQQKGAFVILKFPGGESAQVGLDQEFKIPNDPAYTYKIIDIRPKQVIVRRVEDGQVWTLEKTST
ncbi:MAG: ankyrin repeat domain-containing protein [Verrucomicrobia bacterium]|nr:ankyrin repeat domain-containing protein [Verrucomicrobiota bacterium]